MKNMTKKGFTLIELLVVIVIIGILATIGVAQFSSYFG
ncbi:pilus assembly protein, partial [bacterium DOLZORAL124_38_8]